MAPRCSVIIPTRDCAPYLSSALASVSMQEMADLELIVVDDGSEDGTPALLAEMAGRVPSLRIFRLGGEGPSTARNLGLAHARAPLVAFLDADDFWWPGKLARQLAYHEANPKVGFSFTDYLQISPSGHSLGTCFQHWRPRFAPRPDGGFHLISDPEPHLLGENVVGTSTVVARRELALRVGGFPKLQSAEDWAFWLRLASQAAVAYSTAVTTTYLIGRPNSETAARDRRLAVLQQLYEDYAAQRQRGFALRRLRGRLYEARAEIARADGSFAAAALMHAHSYRLTPRRRVARAVLSDLKSCLLGGGPSP